jgi:hypothetical protein
MASALSLKWVVGQFDFRNLKNQEALKVMAAERFNKAVASC